MKKLYLAVGLAGMMTAPSLFASMQVTLVDNTTLYSYNNGGEFRAVGSSDLDSVVNWAAYSSKTTGTTSDAIDGGSWGYNSGLAVAGNRYFQTFCLEYNEEFTPGTTYNVATSDLAKYGGKSAPGDPISKATAWLYSQFAAGLLDYNYTYGADRTASANDLQQAIWWLEEEGTATRTGDGAHYIDEAEAALGLTDANVRSTDANGAYGVQALNLGAPGEVQDQLVIAVPEPTTILAGMLLLLPFGASTLRVLRRNRAV